jgi:predicted Ser/Thr protein kinase
MATSDDELARTATAPGSSKAAAPELGATLGRYRLERMLGEGGMGVVHAAFDPDLERHVALKVLRTTEVGGDARQRLLREARAMARLTHENVVVVHEVGTAGDRDYVAMELIDGSTLAEWLAAKPRSVFEVVEAFIQAGRGLAAAHAASLVHRDFKPHNVLRRKDGKIMVTDFGLARGVEDAQAVALDVTMRAGAAERSDLSGLTVTGSVLGTPAYMAPEQWVGGIVGAAADQFAFCVALWEALTGARPFKGETIDELKAEVRRGPAALDASKLPRRVRKILVRGLDPDPAKRFPSMDALLAALRRSERKAGLAFAAGGAALAAIVVMLFALRHHGTSCDPPAIDPSKVWSEAFAKGMPPALSELFNAQINHWAVSRASACTAEPLVRPQQLHCLDGALQRIDIVRRVYSTVPNVDEEKVAQSLVDPAVCLVQVPPRLALPATPEVIAAMGLLAKHDDKEPQALLAAAQALAGKPALDPCARTLAQFAVEKATKDYEAQRSLMNEVVASVEQCDDDRLRAEMLLAAMTYQLEIPVIGPRGMAAIKRADAAIQRVPDPTLTARIDFLRSIVAGQANHWKEALDLAEHAIAAYENANQPRSAIHAVLQANKQRFRHGSAADFKAVTAMIAKWLPVARSLHGQDGDSDNVTQLELDAAYVRYWTADMAGGHADILRLWQAKRDRKAKQPAAKSEDDDKVIAIEGEVVDQKGRPVAGATITAGSLVIMDSIGYLPLVRTDAGDRGPRVVTSDATGHFVISDCAEHGAIVAQLGDRRSAGVTIANHLTLTLAPTRRISGKVSLGGLDHTQVTVMIRSSGAHLENFAQVAPVSADGTFVADGATQGPVLATVAVAGSSGSHMASIPVPASSDPVTNVVLDPGATMRTLDVIARSTLSVPLEGVQFIMLAGRFQFATVADLDIDTRPGVAMTFGHHVAGEAIPRGVAAKFKPGDMVGQFTDVPAGEITVCAVSFAGDQRDPTVLAKMQAHIKEFELRCETVDGTATSALITAPPQKSFD